MRARGIEIEALVCSERAEVVHTNVSCSGTSCKIARGSYSGTPQGGSPCFKSTGSKNATVRELHVGPTQLNLEGIPIIHAQFARRAHK